VGPKRAASFALGALMGTLGCGGSGLGPPPSTPRIDYVDGAIEPILVRGQSTVIEGFGFGDSQSTGTVQFASSAGSVPASVTSGGWTDRAIRVVVPDSAASGTITVATATGLKLTAAVHVLPHVPFDPSALSWQGRTGFPRAPAGVALAAGTFSSGGTLRVALYAAGGAEPLGGDSAMVPDSAVFVARTAPGGLMGSWSRSSDLPAPRAFAAAVFANRFNSRFDGAALYIIGGIDSAGHARATVFQSMVSNDTTLAPFTSIEPLPSPVAGAIAVATHGRIYVMGGTDSTGTPQSHVFVGRIDADGHIDGWYVEPSLPAPRAYGGAVVLDTRVAVFGGLADSAAIGGGLSVTTPRLATFDTAGVSPISGFLSGAWGQASALLPDGRSQFAKLRLGDAVLLVGGVYAGAATNSAETIAASLTGDSLGGFAGPVGVNTIAGLGGGTLVGAAAVSWQDADGSYHGIVAGGIDLVTRIRRDGVWGF
jgi:hypothetical protein